MQRGTGYRNGAIIQSMAANLGKHTEQMASFGVPAVDSVAELDEADNVAAEHVPEEESERSMKEMEKEMARTTPRMMVTTTTTILF